MYGKYAKKGTGNMKMGDVFNFTKITLIVTTCCSYNIEVLPY